MICCVCFVNIVGLCYCLFMLCVFGVLDVFSVLKCFVVLLCSCAFEGCVVDRWLTYQINTKTPKI